MPRNAYEETPRGRLTRVGGWDLGATLGRGAYAHVRLATHHNTGSQAACKVLPALHATPGAGPASSDTITDAMEAHKELVLLKALAGAKIPGIVNLLGVLEEGGWTYIFLSLHSHSLSNLRKPMSEKVVCNFFSRLLRTVEALHQLGLSHEDLKRSNILVDTRGKECSPVVVDFGFSHFRPDGGPVRSLGGTFDYSSPQKIADGWYDPCANDIWSLGIVFLKLMRRGHPYLDHSDFDDTPGAARTRLIEGEPLYSFRRTETKPGGLADFVTCMLERDEQLRWTAAELLHHPYLVSRVPRMPQPLYIPPLKLKYNVSRPLSEDIVQDLMFLCYLHGDLYLCETPKHLIRHVYDRIPRWEQRWATMLAGWEKRAEMDWEDALPETREIKKCTIGGLCELTTVPTRVRAIGALREIHLTPLRPKSPQSDKENENHPDDQPACETPPRPKARDENVAKPVTPQPKVLTASRKLNAPLGLEAKRRSGGKGGGRLGPPTRTFPKKVSSQTPGSSSATLHSRRSETMVSRPIRPTITKPVAPKIVKPTRVLRAMRGRETSVATSSTTV